ncbi:MAG: type IV toxin-antitoxin system AbiEi family antitoxin domain-containing protein [Alphaproteobacteria bacterium]
MKKAQKHLHELVPYGLVVTRSWLMDKGGVERHTLDNWIKSEQLVSVTSEVRGVFKLPETTRLTWEGVVCSLQRMHEVVMPGGLTALTLQGHAHYLSPLAHKTVHLYSQEKMPEWINKFPLQTTYIHHKNLPLKALRSTGLKNHVYSTKHGQSYEDTIPWAWRLDEWPLTISGPERAMFEVLMDVPENTSLEHANQLMQGLPMLSPIKLNRLLSRCENVKVKRLFLWLAEKNQLPWLKKIDLDKFSMESGALGSGKRELVKGGKLDPKYLITVPKEMAGNTHG